MLLFSFVCCYIFIWVIRVLSVILCGCFVKGCICVDFIILLFYFTIYFLLFVLKRVGVAAHTPHTLNFFTILDKTSGGFYTVFIT